MSVIVNIVEDVVDAVVDVVEDVIGAVGDAIDWVVDEIVEPVLDGVGDIVQAALDDPITTIAKVTAVATGNAWALPLIDGAAVAANGGDLGDVVKAAAISYTTGKVGDFTSTYVNPKIASAGFNSTVEAAVQAGIKGGTQSATTAIVYGQDPLQAFATGGLNAAVGATLGQIADKIDAKYENFTGEIDVEGNPIVGGWEQLQDGVKDSITASLTAEITGGDVSASQFTSIISKYTGVSETMNKFLQENAGFDESQAIVMTNALTNAATVALEGNPELSSDAFFAKWDEYGMEALKDIVDRPVDAAIDKVTGASSATQDAANALNEASVNAVAAADGIKATQVAIEKKVIEQERLEGIYNAALKAYNKNPTQATVDALNAAAGAYQTFADQFKVDYDSTLKPALDKYKADYNTYTAQIPKLDAAYTAATEAMMSDIDDLNASMKPVYDKATLAAALSLRPNFDAEAYKEFLGQDFDNAAEHFLLNGQQGPASKSEADATLDAIKLSTVENALAAKGLTLASLEPGQLAKYLAYADKEIKNAASITGLDLDKFANTMVADAALTPELTMALKDAGFIPQSTDDYNVFLSGEYIKLDAKNSDGSNIFVDTTGMTGDEVKDLLSANGYSTNNIVNVGNAFKDAFDGGAGDPAFDKPSIDSVDTAVVNFNNNPPEPTLDTVTLGAGVDVNTLTSGGAVLVNTDGKLSWELPSTKQEKLGETNVSSVASSANPNLDVVDIAFNALYAPLEFKEVPPGFSYLSNDGMTAFTEDGQISAKNLPPASGVVVATIAGLDDDQGKQFDEDTGGTLWSIYNELKQVYLNETPDDQQEAFGNAASVVTGATGEMLQAISGLATLVGANPNNTVGQTAKNLLALSGDLRSDAWVAAAEDMQKRSQDYDKEWRQNNPGKEPTAAQKGWLKAQSIWGNLTDHPVQFLAENVASEILQEIPILVVSGGVGNVAKAALLQGGEAYAKKFATKAAVGSAVALDAAEAFGGTAAGAFDETYANAIAQGMSEQEATDLAMDTAQKAGTIALFTTAASAGIGGAALAKNLLGDNASEFAGDAFQKLGKKIQDGGTVAIKEGTTEFIEEALPQLFTATVNSQIDPNYDVAGSVFENGFMGAVSGYGVGATLYTGNAVADALMSLNPTVINTVKNAGSAEAATAALNNLGITDTTILNNVLNSTYDTMYVSTNEAAKLFKDANPEFEPTDAEIESFVSNRPESDVAAVVASYIDPKFLDADEVKAAAAAEGITLTDEQAEAYVGQKDEAQAIEEIAAEYDPQGTTREEAEQFFAELGYNPTEEEILAHVGATPDADQKEAIASYVDPRQVTEAEARKFFEDKGYDPTDEEVATFVGQLNQAAQETAIGEYVDPRQTTEDEVRAAFEAAGFTPTDEQVAQFVGQLDQAAQETAVGQFVDPRQTTEDEVRAAFEALGFIPTDEQVTQFVGQLDQAAQETAIGQFVDPRQTTEDEVRAAFEALGFTPTDAEVTQFVGQLDQAAQETGIGEYVDPRQTTEDEVRSAFAALGFTPTDEQVTQFVGQYNQSVQETAVGQFVDPRQVTDEEARQFFADLGYTPTDEQVAEFVAQVSETEQAAAIASYVDPRQVTFAEVQAIADEEGLTLTDALAATYVSQGVAANYQTEKLSAARAEYDPLATTLEEATQFFADTGYTATPEEIAQFVASKTEETQTSAIGSYVDPRQVTAAEAEEFLSAIGYQPSQEDIAAFTGQVNDENYQTTQKAAIDEFVDPRFFDAGEVRAAYEELGLVDVTQEDVDRFVGQFDPESEDYDAAGFEAFQRKKLESYLPTATYNLISKTIGSPAVEDDPNTPEDESKEATGIYKAIEDGTSKDDALETAIAKLTEDLGLSEDAMLEQLGLTKKDLEKAIGDVETSLGEDISDLADVIGTPATDDAEATGIFADIADLVASGSTQDEAIQAVADNLGTTKADLEKAIGTVETSLGEDISDLADVIGTPATDDAEATGIFADIAELIASGATQDEAIQAVADNLGTTKTDLEKAIANIDVTEQITNVIGTELGTPATDDAEATGIFADIDDLVASGSTQDEAIQAVADNLGTTKADLEKAIGAVETSLGEDISGLAGILGTPEVLDDPDTLDVDESQDPTGLFATIQQYENAGVKRDEALSLAIGDVASALGTTETNLLNAIGVSKTDILNELSTTKSDILGELETGLGALEESFGADIDTIANIIGKPAREVTQVDVDFVIDLIAQENVSQELVTQYDVTGDGIIDINDQILLETALQGENVAFADTSIFGPATGLYGTAADIQQQLQSDMDTQTDAITDMINNLTTQVTTQQQQQQQQENLRDLLAMEQAGLFKGAKTTVSSADPMNIDYLYDFSSIFANPSQQGLFASPYSTTTRNKAANQPAGPMPTASGFAKGGQVEDENDMLLRILGDM